MISIVIHPEVLDATRSGRAVVALETAVLTHGLPRSGMTTPPCAEEFLNGSTRRWDESAPANLELSRAASAVVRATGAVPATVAVLDGVIRIGLDDAELERLGRDAGAVKVSTRDLAVATVRGESGGTTVAGTLSAIARANRTLDEPIRVFATGGIGGVHRRWTDRPDISADLGAIARVPVCTVSAGAKSILDLAATLEALDALAVPVLGFGTEWFPRFLTEGGPPLAVSRPVESIDDIARIASAHWDLASESAGGRGATGGVLVANPPPQRWALPREAMESLIEDGVRAAHERGVQAAAVTPFLLSRLADATRGASVAANIAVLLGNARVAGILSQALKRVETAAQDHRSA